MSRGVEVAGFNTVRSIVAARAWSALAARFALTNSGRFRLRRTAHRADASLVCRGRRVGSIPTRRAQKTGTRKGCPFSVVEVAGFEENIFPISYRIWEGFGTIWLILYPYLVDFVRFNLLQNNDNCGNCGKNIIHFQGQTYLLSPGSIASGKHSILLSVHLFCQQPPSVRKA